MRSVDRKMMGPVAVPRRARSFMLTDENRVGKGLFADVFRQRIRGGRWIAVKVDADLVSAGENAGVVLRREAKVHSALRHPNIVEFLGSGELVPSMRFFLAVEYLEGYLRSFKFVKTATDPVAAALLVLEIVAAALAYIHSQGLVHSDLKPDNVMAHGESVKLIDFGFCRPSGQPVPPESNTWVAGGIGYQSWQRWQKVAPVPQDDIYALGVMLYQYLLRPDKVLSVAGHSLAETGDLAIYRQGVYQQGTVESFEASQKEIGASISASKLPSGVKLLLERLLGVNGKRLFNNCHEIEVFIKEFNRSVRASPMNIVGGYFPESRRIQLNPSFCGGRRIGAEFFPAAFTANSAVWQRIRDDCVGVSKKYYAGKVKGDRPGYWNERIEGYLRAESSARLGVVWEEDIFRGFGITRELTTEAGTTFHFVLTIIDPDLQQAGIATYLQARAAHDYMEQIGAEEIFVSFDSPNPVVISTITRHLFDPFPDPRQPDKQPSLQVQQMLSAIAGACYPGSQYDPRVSVIRDWYLNIPNLLYRAERVPHYKRDAGADAFCHQALRCAQERGDKMLVIGKASRSIAMLAMGAFEVEAKV